MIAQDNGEFYVSWDRKSLTQESSLVLNSVAAALGLSVVSVTYVVSDDSWYVGILYTYFVTVLFVFLMFFFIIFWSFTFDLFSHNAD